MLLPAVLQGANITFPGSGGDLAGTGESDWNRPLPTKDDNALLDNPGIYTLSSDITFKGLRPQADGIILRFGEHRLTTTGILGGAQGATVIYDGGTFDLSGTGSFSPVQAAVTDACTVITNGCVVTNVNVFYATRYASSSRTVVTGGSRVYAASCNVSDQDGVRDSLEIMDGAQVHIDGEIKWDSGILGTYGGSCIIVSGAGSLLRQKGGTSSNPNYMKVGNRFTDDSLIVTDGASAISDFGGVTLGQPRSSLMVEKGASASFPHIYFTGSEGGVTISNGTLTCTTAFSMAYADGATAYNPVGNSNNVFLATGPDTVVTLMGPDFFGTGHHNTVRVEGGAKLTQNSGLNEFMSQTCSSRVLISGAGTVFGKSDGVIAVAYRTSATDGVFNSVSNIVSVSDGATLQGGRMYLQGVANELLISNATVSITGGDSSNHAFTSGSRANGTTHTNNTVTLCGETPKFMSTTEATRCRFLGGSTLRICVPVEGYARGYVPVDLACNFMLDSTSLMELDCNEWAERTGGTLHLISAAAFEDYSADAKGTTAARLAATSLPPDCRLVVELGNVYLKCPIRKGFQVVIR